MEAGRDDILQGMCRGYLRKLMYMAEKHGLGMFVRDVIRQNRRGECKATEKEVGMLARMCDDERILRKDVPDVVGMSYRECLDEGLFGRVRKLPHKGIYSKVSAVILKSKRI